jgi:pimeloyl-ACP methyl ester carboxylesterase
MAEELFEVLRPHMEGQSQLHLAGHSLGGSLATLVALTAHLRLGGSSSSNSSTAAASHHQQQQQLGAGGLQVQCTTFGSPPVLALAAGAGEDGGSMLQALRMAPGSVRNYVLQVKSLRSLWSSRDSSSPARPSTSRFCSATPSAG